MRESGGLELASTITLVLQANLLTKCASHPKTQEFHPLLGCHVIGINSSFNSFLCALRFSNLTRQAKVGH